MFGDPGFLVVPQRADQVLFQNRKTENSYQLPEIISPYNIEGKVFIKNTKTGFYEWIFHAEAHTFRGWLFYSRKKSIFLSSPIT